ncbi:hypothetical protein ACFRNT_11430 [Streptomyces sp. NPDC056697]|uniref:hypothetical protein n=1 Tax=Streptomyces sp. NPDC056697 TaxID=3345915 RepID=UPI0036AF01E4
MADWAAMVEARDAEIARLRDLLRAEHERANAAIDREEPAEEHAEELERERDRYRLAWLSARRRAAVEANHGTDAVEHYEAKIQRLEAANTYLHDTIDTMQHDHDLWKLGARPLVD